MDSQRRTEKITRKAIPGVHGLAHLRSLDDMINNTYIPKARHRPKKKYQSALMTPALIRHQRDVPYRQCKIRGPP